MKKHDKINSFEPEFNTRKNTLLSFERLHMKDLLFMLYDITAVTVAYFFALWFRFDCRFSEIPENIASKKLLKSQDFRSFDVGDNAA